jgi:hypothetical protein
MCCFRAASVGSVQRLEDFFFWGGGWLASQVGLTGARSSRPIDLGKRKEGEQAAQPTMDNRFVDDF